MRFEVSESDIAGYYSNGYVVFRQVLPVSLIGDLRREADKTAVIARRAHGQQSQRLQPLKKYEAELNMKPFQDYAELPALRDALTQVLSPNHYYGKSYVLGILLNPAAMPWCTPWHRDITLASSRLTPEEFQDLLLDWNSVNQINCPLYDDECTWFVPGSHLRSRDMPGEVAAANPSVPVDHGPESKITDPVEKERLCWNYTASMPGAVQIRLNAGDFAMYRPLGWHIGNYVPYKKRATLHDAVLTPKYEAWRQEWIRGGSPKWEIRAQRI